MLPIRRGLCWLAFPVALSTAALVFAGSNFRQNAPRTKQSPSDNATVYFPKGTGGSIADFASSYLASIGEPSLLATAHDTNTVSYRLTCMGCRGPHLLVVRFSLDSNGNAAITTTIAALHLPGPPTVSEHAQRTATREEVDQFFQAIDKADFWSMPATEPQNPDPNRRVIKLDAARMVFEGARRGAYHVVFREGPEPSAFTDMVRFVAKVLGGWPRDAL